MSMGFNQYGNGFRNNMNINSNPIGNNPNGNQISPTFQIVYGLLSCAQSILSILGSIVDVTFFFKSIKEILFDFIIGLLKKLLRFTYYLVTLGFIKDSFYLSNSAVKVIVNNSFGKIMLKITSITTILLFFVALYLKFIKTNQIYENKSDDTVDEDKNDEEGIKTNDDKDNKSTSEQSNLENSNKNLKISEERWIKTDKYK